MNRHTIRELTFKMIFGAEFNPVEELPGKFELFFQNCDSELTGRDEVIDEADAEIVKKRAADVIAHLDEIDKNISDKAQGWTKERMGKAELSLIRLAVYEMYFDESIPTGVAINEAVSLAKEYCDENGSSFVNGILSKLVPGK